MASPRRFPWWPYLLLLIAIIVLAASPLISVMIAGAIAESHGCVLHEGYVNPCIVNGRDIGSGLYTAFVLGWLMLATIPAGLAALMAWLAVLVIHLFIHRHRGRSI